MFLICGRVSAPLGLADGPQLSRVRTVGPIRTIEIESSRATSLRILTVRQPWASLIVMGHKPVENRPWRTSYRGDVAILAGRAIDLGDRAIEATRRCLTRGIDRCDVERAISSLPRGGIIGMAELWGETRQMESWWFTGPIGLLFRGGRSTEGLIPWRGSLAFLSATEKDEREIRSLLV